MLGLSNFIYSAFLPLAVKSAFMSNQHTFFQEYKYPIIFTSIVLVILIGMLKNYMGYRVLAGNKARHGRPSRSRTNELGSGDLARKEHIMRWATPTDEFDTYLPVKDLRGSDGIAVKEGNLIIPREERNRHVLIIAKTGSGKTTKMILPVLYSDCINPNRSTIVLDSKPEMWEKLAGLTRKYNPEKRIMLFNPLDTSRSFSWNILGKIESDTDAKLIANTLVMATDNPNSKSDSPFFRNNALQLLNAIMVGLLNDPHEILSMPRVHELVHSGMHGLCDWLEAHPVAIRTSRTFVELARSGSQNADTIMSELSMRLAAWDLTAIRATTAQDELDVEALITEPTLFIVELRESELEMLRPMANVIVVELLRFLTKRAETCPKQTLPRPVSLVIDEFASALGRLPDIHVKLNTLRSRNVSIVGAIQSIAQVRANYDKDADSVLSGFSTKIFMPALDFQDAEWASKETGTKTVRFNVNSKGKNKRMVDYFSHNNANIQEQVQQRAVLTPDEIGRPSDNACTFYMPNTPVFQGHLIAYYKVPEMVKRFNEGQELNFQPRESPIIYEEKLPEPGPAGGGNSQQAPGQSQGVGSIFNLTPDQVREALENIKPEIGWNEVDPLAREWWISFETANAHNLVAVLNLAHELRKRHVTISEFYTIYATTGLQDVPQILAAIDQHIYNEFKRQLEWDNTSQTAKDWWIAFEEANKANFPVVVELAKELIKRGVVIDDFFNAYVHSDFETIPEILGVIDHLLAQGKIGKEARAKVEAQHAATRDEPPQVVIQSSVREQPAARPPDPQPQKAAPAVEKAPPAKPAPSKQPEQPFPPMSQEARKKAAVQNVHVNSYFAMADELLRLGKNKDFEVLVSMAKDDPRFTEDDIKQILAMKNYYDNTAGK